MKVSIDGVKRRISPSMFYSRELNLVSNSTLRKWVNGGLCPFHPDKRVGNFRINIQTGAFKCFACGAKGGDVINFMCARYGFSISECLERLGNANY